MLNPRTNEPVKIVSWAATKQFKKIPIPHHFHDGYLDRMELWAFDEDTATAANKFTDSDTVLRLVDAKDLLRFRERDIHTLAQHQIIYKTNHMELMVKELTSMVAKIIEKRLWMGAMGKSNVVFKQT